MPNSKAFDNFPKELRAPFGPYMGVVDTVHDGDTLLVRISSGFDLAAVVWIRLVEASRAGVYAPELSQPGGKETRAFVEDLCPYETPCRVTTGKTPKTGAEEMSFVRYIGSVELAGGRDLGELVSEFIKKNGYGPGNT